MKSSEMTPGMLRAMHREPALQMPKAVVEALERLPSSIITHSNPAPKIALDGVLIENPANTSQPNANHTHGKIQNTKPKRHKTPALGGTGEGEKEVLHRTIVRFVGYRVRPLDPDNFAGSVKDLLDGCRHAGLIHGDEPWRIILETEQIKVRKFSEEKTEITITTP